MTIGAVFVTLSKVRTPTNDTCELCRNQKQAKTPKRTNTNSRHNFQAIGKGKTNPVSNQNFGSNGIPAACRLPRGFHGSILDAGRQVSFSIFFFSLFQASHVHVFHSSGAASCKSHLRRWDWPNRWSSSSDAEKNQSLFASETHNHLVIPEEQQSEGKDFCLCTERFFYFHLLRYCIAQRIC